MTKDDLIAELREQNEGYRAEYHSLSTILDKAGVGERGARNDIRVERLVKERDELRDACAAALSFWERYVDRVGPTDSWALTVLTKLRRVSRK